MRGSISPYRVRLNKKPRKRLEKLVRRRTPQHWRVIRAKIILLANEGLRIFEICDALSLDHQVVRRWIKRYLEGGFDGLEDRKRSGRPAQIEPKVWQKIATLVVQSPEKFGVPLARWSVRSLSAFLEERYGWKGGTQLDQLLSSLDGAQAPPSSLLAQPDGPRLRQKSSKDLQAVPVAACEGDRTEPR